MTTLTQDIEALQDRIATAAESQGSLEWYLKNNLVGFDAAMRTGGKEFESAARALMRFCTESMDWDTPLYREAIGIAEKGLRMAKG